MKNIGRYEIVGRLGRGGSSTVYKARAPITGRLVAVKLLQPRSELLVELVGVDRLRQLFVAEAKIMGAISHEHVAKVVDCDHHEGNPFIVLEYYARSLGSFIGESYRVESPSRVVSIAKTKEYLIQALKGLERLHFAGIVHRDIKPYNLMLTNDDRIKIIDFGLSRVRGEDNAAIPGMQVGSPFYAAPEQAGNAQQADGRADLYSIGVMAWRMVTGQLFDFRAGVQQALEVAGIMPETPWGRWLIKSVARHPGDRFQSALEMRLALEELPITAVMERYVAIPAGKGNQQPPRQEPARVLWKDIRDLLQLDDLMRPLTYALPEITILSPQLAYDRQCDLLWQRLGSGFTLDWQQAWQYVEDLNKNLWQGRDTWRLPTLEEIRAILVPPVSMEGDRGPAIFHGGPHWLWTSDTCTKKQAWMVDVAEGYFDRLDKDGAAGVCAVSVGLPTN